jgi:citrate lyase beta subunit
MRVAPADKAEARANIVECANAQFRAMLETILVRINAIVCERGAFDADLEC